MLNFKNVNNLNILEDKEVKVGNIKIYIYIISENIVDREVKVGNYLKGQFIKNEVALYMLKIVPIYA